jgi:hypothetical protein
MAELKDVEIARVGQWNLASGPARRDPADADRRRRVRQPPNARPGYRQDRAHRPPVHRRRRTVPGLAAEPPRRGIRRRLGPGRRHRRHARVAGRGRPKHWPDRSMEGWTDYEVDGRTYAMVVDGLALLGVTPPGMSSLRSLRDLPQALGVAASARIVASSRPLPHPHQNSRPRPRAGPSTPKEVLPWHSATSRSPTCGRSSSSRRPRTRLPSWRPSTPWSTSRSRSGPLPPRPPRPHRPARRQPASRTPCRTGGSAGRRRRPGDHGHRRLGVGRPRGAASSASRPPRPSVAARSATRSSARPSRPGSSRRSASSTGSGCGTPTPRAPAGHRHPHPQRRARRGHGRARDRRGLHRRGVRPPVPADPEGSLTHG